MGVNAPARTVGDNSHCWSDVCRLFFLWKRLAHLGPGVVIVLIYVLIYRSGHDFCVCN